MLIECKNLLAVLVPPEAMDTFIRADQVLNELEIRSQDMSITNIAMDDNSLTMEDRVDGIRHVYIEQLVDVIRKFGVTVNDHAVMRDLVCVLEGLTRLDNWGDEDTIVDTAKSDTDSVEVLSRLLAIVTEIPAEHYLEVLVDVDAALLTRLVETIERHQFSDSPTVNRLIDEVRDRILYWIKHFPESRLRYWLEDKVSPGEPVEYYLNLLSEVEVGAIHSSPEFAADYILSAVVMSDTVNNRVHSAVQDIFDNTFNDLAFVTKADTIVEQQLFSFKGNN